MDHFYCGERWPDICFVLGLEKSSTYSSEYASSFSWPVAAHLSALVHLVTNGNVR